MIAHAIGHHLLHPGNHLRMRERGLLSDAVEREAEEFAGALLIDERETLGLGISEPRYVAEYFGVPEEMVRRHVLPASCVSGGAEASPPEAPGAGTGHSTPAPAPPRRS
ncbi:MAG: ImmA/IrrE family metallo-endopeptidase [Chloroflexi bacterium]|nr:ImmA/IrrE family metallo-endopeptidase [Chloroflexota bacterium]